MVQPTRAFISHPRYTARFVKLVPSLCLLYFRANVFIIICVCGSPPVLLRLLQAYVECCSSIICIVYIICIETACVAVYVCVEQCCKQCCTSAEFCVSFSRHNILLTFNFCLFTYLGARASPKHVRYCLPFIFFLLLLSSEVGLLIP